MEASAIEDYSLFRPNELIFLYELARMQGSAKSRNHRDVFMTKRSLHLGRFLRMIHFLGDRRVSFMVVRSGSFDIKR